MTSTDQHHVYDVLIIGSGAAGLTAALRLPHELSVAVVSKTELMSGSTPWAQGGVAAVTEASDSFENHIEDTMQAGAGLCKPDRVAQVVQQAPEMISWLVSQGVKFDHELEAAVKSFHLTQEGGHSHRRILHAADATGQAVGTALAAAVKARSNITILTNKIAVDVLRTADTRGRPHKRIQRCNGMYLYDMSSHKVETCLARFTLLASGGASKVYLYTSNPDGSTGDGVAIGWRSGAKVANMEFNQFHPTCLYHPDAKSFLITEAVRGEGGLLLRPDGTRFMPQHHELAELAPRDIVARAIDHEMKRLGADCMYLDISHKPASFIKEHFPTVYQRCLSFGIDMTKDPIPVVPAAHYTCGGLVTDEHARTTVDGLYAAGEVASTGLHGANRMASNSLLECFVFGSACADHIGEMIAAGKAPDIGGIQVIPWDESQVTDSDEDVVIAHNWDELRRTMWNYVGIVRTDKRLQRAQHRIALLQQEIHEYYSQYRISCDLLELRNLATVAELIVHSALFRRESRGLHYTLDYPKRSIRTYDTILQPPSLNPFAEYF
ncbi:L-aspartate oxidase [Allohahella marinimesophila]|uniref:L-aspartate oxidase n=1 Tax=Allohahella marinimesophila TaxID=1054972 RepID=A0ABP7Q4L8_9GAMM